MKERRLQVGLGCALVLGALGLALGSAEAQKGVAAARAAKLLAKGEAQLNGGDLDGAIATFSQVIKEVPGDPHGYYQRGVCYERKKNVTAAEIDYRKALKLRPAFAEAHNNLGAVLQDGGKSPEAIDHFKEAVKVKPDYGEAWFNLGLALYGQKKFADASAAYKRAARLRPRDVDVRINLGGALRQLGDVDGALLQLRMAVQLAPRDAMARFSYGALLAEKRKHKEAIAELREAVKIDPKYLRAWRQLAFSEAALGEIGAVASLRQAIKLAPREAALHADLGRVLKKQGKPKEALEAYRAALRIDPGFVRAHLFSGLVLAEQGDCAGAKRAFQTFLAKQKDASPGALKKLLEKCRK
jgi:Tfp pilus assembly protein PilF